MSKPARTSLNHKLITLLLSVLVLMSLVFFLLFWATYQTQLRGERSEASRTVNQLLQASLENAMLKRDIPGLRGIVKRLSEQPEIRDVVILNPRGEVRFSGANREIGKPYEIALRQVCPSCTADMQAARPSTQFTIDRNGHEVLRSVNPVRNHFPCSQCHGDPKQHPVNGILVVDYDAQPVIRKARSSLAGLAAAGLIITLMTSWLVWRFMRRYVIGPVSQLTQVSQEIAQGNLKERVKMNGSEEFENLADNFNLMADRLDASLEQLLEKETYLQALIDAIPDAIRVIDENYTVVQANAAYRKMLGLDDKQAIGQPCYVSSHNRESPCPHTLLTCPVYEIAKNGEPVKTMQQFIPADVNPREVQVFAAPMSVPIDNNGKPYIVESIRDLIHDLRFSHEQQLAALGELAAGVAHEINNPLASIRLALQSVIGKLDSTHASPENLKNYLALVDGEIDKCIAVSQSLLKLTTLPGEKRQLVEINTAIRETVSLLRYEAEKSGISIELKLADPTPRMIAADNEIRMVVLNLTQNAFHAMPNGGTLTIRSSEENNAIIMIFEDNGAGIRPEDKPYIFDPFFSHRVDEVHGVGLGLTICQSIVDRYNGEIQVSDVLPHGARFTVRIPVDSAS